MAVVPALLATPSAALGDLASSAWVAARPTRGDDVLEDHGGSILCPGAGHLALSRGYPGRLRFVPARGPPAAGRKQQIASRHLHRAEDSQPRFRHAPVAAANQCRASQHLNFSRQAGSDLSFRLRPFWLFSFHRNLGSIVAVGSARLECLAFGRVEKLVDSTRAQSGRDFVEGQAGLMG